MSLFLCVDCGGSKTSIAIATKDGTIVSRATGGPSNFAYLGIEVFLLAVQSTISAALASLTNAEIESTALPPEKEIFAIAWFGVSGCDSPQAIVDLTRPLARLLNLPESRVRVANDTHLLASPLLKSEDDHVKHCIAVVGGTGAICVGFKKAASGGALDEVGRIGGWGWLLGDEGGGFHLGREGVRQVLAAFDEASHTPESYQESTLTQALLALYQIKHVPEILPLLHMPDPAPSSVVLPDAPPHLSMPKEKRLSTLSPLIFKCAFEDGDPVALRALKVSAGSLADQIALLLVPESAGATNKPKASESIVSFGGSLVMIASYRNLVLEALKEKGHVFRHVETVDDAAAVGCVALAGAYN